MLTGRNILVVDGIPVLVLRQLLLRISISDASTQTIVPFRLCPYFTTTHAVVVQIRIRQVRQLVFRRLEIRSRRRKLVLHLIIIYRGRIVVVALRIFGREIEVVAHLRFQMLVALHDPNARHIEVVVLLLQRRRPESHTIAGTDGKIAQWLVTNVQLRREMRILSVGEIVVAQRPHQLPLVVEAPVVLGKEIPTVLLSGLSLQIGVVEIVVQQVGTHGQHVASPESMIVEQAEGILHITIVTDVQTGDTLIVRLVILVERITCLQVVSIRNLPVHAQTAREVTVALRLVGRPHRFTEEISRTPRQTEVAGRTPRQLLLQIDRLVPIHRRDDAGHGIRRTVHIVIVHAVEVGRKHIVPVLRVQSPRSPISLLVVLSISGVHVERPGLSVALGDDVDHAARSIAAVERRSRTLHDLDTFHIIHVQTGEIHIVHRLSRQSLAVHEKEHTLSSETGEVEMRLLVHRIREFHARQFLLQQVLHIGSIQSGKFACTDHARLNRRVLQEFRRTGARHHHLVEVELATNGVHVSIIRVHRSRSRRRPSHEHGE